LFSHRAEKGVTGRMMAVAGIKPTTNPGKSSEHKNSLAPKT
jgi:hypothetical protein